MFEIKFLVISFDTSEFDKFVKTDNRHLDVG